MALRTVLVLVGFGFAAPALSAQAPDGWPVEIDALVRELVADEWALDPTAIELEWGPTGSMTPAADAPVRLVGSGTAGSWIVRLGTPDGGSLSVRLRAGHRDLRPVAAARIARGTEITPAHLRMEERFVWGAPVLGGARVEPGWVAQRPLAIGDELVEPAVRAPWVVKSGASVDVLWVRGAIQVTMPGRAAGSGALGDEVRVRTESGKRLSGVIVAPGVVDVTRASARVARGGES